MILECIPNLHQLPILGATNIVGQVHLMPIDFKIEFNIISEHISHFCESSILGQAYGERVLKSFTSSVSILGVQLLFFVG